MSAEIGRRQAERRTASLDASRWDQAIGSGIGRRPAGPAQRIEQDPTAASHLPELAMLSVMAHPELEIAEAAIHAISGLPADRVRLYLDVIMKALPANARQVVEAQMIKGYQYRSDFARKYYGQGHEEGRQEGLHAGLQAAAVALARTKLDALPDDRAAIEAVADPDVLTELITSLGAARGVAEARVTLDRALARRTSQADAPPSWATMRSRIALSQRTTESSGPSGL